MLSLRMEEHKERIHRAIQPNITLDEQPSDVITRSWLRCIKDYGLSPENHSTPPVLTFCELQEQLERNHPLVQARSEEHTSELQSRGHLVCRLLLEKKN